MHIIFCGTVVFDQFGDKLYMELWRKFHWFLLCYFCYDLINVMIVIWENRHTVTSNYSIYFLTQSYYSITCIILTSTVIATILILSTFEFEFEFHWLIITADLLLPCELLPCQGFQISAGLILIISTVIVWWSEITLHCWLVIL